MSGKKDSWLSQSGKGLKQFAQPLIDLGPNQQVPELRESVMLRAHSGSETRKIAMTERSLGSKAEFLPAVQEGIEARALKSRHYANYTGVVYTALGLLCELIVDPFAIFTGCLSIASVLYYTYAYDKMFAYPVSWSCMSFVVIFPITYVIGQAFRRRENGLEHLAQIKSLLVHVYIAHSEWDWGKDKNGRSAIPEEHAAGVKRILLDQADILSDALMLPPLCATATREQPEAYSMESIEYYSARLTVRERSMCRMMHTIKRLAMAVELLKYHGLPANEASRVNQYSHMIQTNVNNLLQLKDYRTPLRVRAFVRVYIALLPGLYGPYYADMAKKGLTVWFAIVFALFISTALVALFNVQVGLEDAFVAGNDGIDLQIWKDGLRQQLDALEDPVVLEWDNRKKD
jgi:hypothetical protein